MNTHADKKEENKRQSTANTINKKQSGNAPTFQFVDNRPEAVTQRKLHDKITNGTHKKQSKTFEEIPKKVTQLATTKITASNDVVQLGKDDEARKRRKKAVKRKYGRRLAKKPGSDSEEEYLPPNRRRKHRQTFSKRLRKQVITRAPRNKSGLYVCPGCGMP